MILAFLKRVPLSVYALLVLAVAAATLGKLWLDSRTAHEVTKSLCIEATEHEATKTSLTAREAQVEALTRGVVTLSEELRLRDLVAKNAMARAERAEAEAADYRRKQQEAKRNDPLYAEWASRPVPSGVVDRLLCARAGREACPSPGN